MGQHRLTVTARGAADAAHADLVAAIGIGLPPTHAMTGSIVLANAAKNVLFQATGNFQGQQHVELFLMSRLYDFCAQQGVAGVAGFGPFQMPANSRVYLYVYDSPCVHCARMLTISLGRWMFRNPTVHWKLGYTVLYLEPRPAGHVSVAAAQAAMTALGVAVKHCP
jgi:hypothetical protein